MYYPHVNAYPRARYLDAKKLYYLLSQIIAS